VTGRLVCVPILHGSLPFALAVRRAFLRERPDCVAVELPETLTEPIDRAVRRLPLLSVLRYEMPDGPAFLLVEPCDGIFEALRLAREHQVPSHLVDRDSDRYDAPRDALPDPHAIDRIGYEAYVEKVAPVFLEEAISPEDELREATMAFHLSRLLEEHEKVLFVCGLGHALRVQKKLEGSIARPLGRTKRPGVQVFHLHHDSSREVLSEPGHVQARFETWRRAESEPTVEEAGRYRIQGDLISKARERMEKEDGELLGAHAIRIALQFARNQAIARGALAPDLFELTIAARGVASDDFAWHVWDLGVTYPHQTDRPDLAVYRLTIDELQHGARRLWFRRRRKARRHALRLVRAGQKEPTPGAWGDPLRDPYICSYPPEDLRI